jgi:hypothetical protein
MNNLANILKNFKLPQVCKNFLYNKISQKKKSFIVSAIALVVFLDISQAANRIYPQENMIQQNMIFPQMPNQNEINIGINNEGSQISFSDKNSKILNEIMRNANKTIGHSNTRLLLDYFKNKKISQENALKLLKAFEKPRYKHRTLQQKIINLVCSNSLKVEFLENIELTEQNAFDMFLQFGGNAIESQDNGYQIISTVFNIQFSNECIANFTEFININLMNVEQFSTIFNRIKFHVLKNKSLKNNTIQAINKILSGLFEQKVDILNVIDTLNQYIIYDLITDQKLRAIIPEEDIHLHYANKILTQNKFNVDKNKITACGYGIVTGILVVIPYLFPISNDFKFELVEESNNPKEPKKLIEKIQTKYYFCGIECFDQNKDNNSKYYKKPSLNDLTNCSCFHNQCMTCEEGYLFNTGCVCICCSNRDSLKKEAMDKAKSMSSNIISKGILTADELKKFYDDYKGKDTDKALETILDGTKTLDEVLSM